MMKFIKDITACVWKTLLKIFTFVWFGYLKDRILFWQGSDLYKYDHDAMISAFVYSMKYRYLPNIIMACAYVIDFALLKGYGITWWWFVLNILLTYWFVADAYARGHIDLLFRCAYLDVAGQRDSLLSKQKKATKKTKKKEKK